KRANLPPCGADVRQDRGGQRRAPASLPRRGTPLMRPSLLDPLFAPVTSLDGIGPKVAEMIGRVVPADVTDRALRVADLLFTLPYSVIDRRSRPEIAFAAEGAIVTLEVTVDRHQPPPRGNRNVPYRVYAFDDTGQIALTFFHVKGDWLQKA